MQVIRSSVDHPGYPIVLHAILTVGEKLGVDSRRGRVRLAQATTAACGLLMVLCAYLLARCGIHVHVGQIDEYRQ